MRERPGVRGWSIGRIAAASAATAMLAFASVSCGSDADQSGSAGDTAGDTAGGTEGGTAGDAAAARGELLARSSGCAGCHGQDFDGGAGPSLVGLAGSEVVLVDGSTVIADTAYLIRSIADPSADLVADYNLRMPANGLSDAEIADIVAYIETLADG